MRDGDNMALPKVMTVEDFEDFAVLPENAHRRLEWIEGEIHEVVSNNLSSGVAARATALVGGFIVQHELGIITAADGGYKIGTDRFIPDFAFVSHAKQHEHTHDAYNPIAPDLVIEVVSPSNSGRELDKKVKSYLSVGATVWLFDPIDRTTKIYAPGQAMRILELDDTLDGGVLLPGFSVRVRKIFGV